ncbi:hypothetical protein GCM10007301_48100 [Azorhizobium oxalatiphilum]|uniref:Uncharacterized protein n=1 Tax=Azorhizobium oxalatiphilum TaxID=980631 RepID=A0A917CBE5_9HYPH|nr:hypothetical protein GCM10007301_48100 [Azorhizobium oxalatiphilum]
MLSAAVVAGFPNGDTILRILSETTTIGSSQHSDTRAIVAQTACVRLTTDVRDSSMITEQLHAVLDARDRALILRMPAITVRSV